MRHTFWDCHGLQATVAGIVARVQPVLLIAGLLFDVLRSTSYDRVATLDVHFPLSAYFCSWF